MLPDTVIVHPLSDSSYHLLLTRARHCFTTLAILLSLLTVALIVSTSSQMSKRFSVELTAIITFSLLSDCILQIAWDPILLFPIPCAVRNSPVFVLPGSSHTYFKLWVATTTQIAPAYIACALYRHQAILPPGSRWRLSFFTLILIVASVSLMGHAMPIMLHQALEPAGSIEKYKRHLSPSIPYALLSSADCYDILSLRPFGALALTIAFVCAVTSIVLVRHIRLNLRVASLLSEMSRIHHSTMTQVLIMQALVPAFCVALPLAIAVTTLIAEIDGSGGHFTVSAGVIIPHCLLLFSTHSFFQSLLLISTTPIYRRRLQQSLLLLRETMHGDVHGKSPNVLIVKIQTISR